MFKFEWLPKTKNLKTIICTKAPGRTMTMATIQERHEVHFITTPHELRRVADLMEKKASNVEDPKVVGFSMGQFEIVFYYDVQLCTQSNPTGDISGLTVNVKFDGRDS